MITLIIADDHPIFRKGLIQTINQNPNFKIIGEANNGNAALKLILELQPTIAILDINMPELTGLDVATRLLTGDSKTKCIILTLHKEVDYYLKAQQLGIMGYILKDDAITDIENGIISVANNQHFISNEFVNVLNQLQKNTLDNYNLTNTELIILKLVTQGKSSNQIADLIFLSPKTVDNHRSNITKKFGLEGKNALVTFALQNKDWLSNLS